MPTEFDKWRDQKIIEIADEVAEMRDRSMDIRQIVEDTLVAPMRAKASRPHLTVTQERNATDTAINELRIAEAYDRPLHMGPFGASLILKRLDRLQMLASGYSEATSKYESLVGDLLKMLDNDDLDGARDLVKAEYDAIHGPRD